MSTNYSREYYQRNKEKIKAKYQEKKRQKLLLLEGVNKEQQEEQSPRVQSPIQQPKLSDKSLEIISESDLHLQIVNYMKLYYPDTLLMSLPIDKISKESIPAAMKYGYQKGMPDILIIHNTQHYSGLALELKRPKPSFLTQASDHQIDVLNKLQKQRFKCIISNDLLHIIREITLYLSST